MNMKILIWKDQNDPFNYTPGGHANTREAEQIIAEVRENDPNTFIEFEEVEVGDISEVRAVLGV
jgi:hypothetical protein